MIFFSILLASLDIEKKNKVLNKLKLRIFFISLFPLLIVYEIIFSNISWNKKTYAGQRNR